MRGAPSTLNPQSSSRATGGSRTRPRSQLRRIQQLWGVPAEKLRDPEPSTVFPKFQVRPPPLSPAPRRAAGGSSRPGEAYLGRGMPGDQPLLGTPTPQGLLGTPTRPHLRAREGGGWTRCMRWCRRTRGRCALSRLRCAFVPSLLSCALSPAFLSLSLSLVSLARARSLSLSVLSHARSFSLVSRARALSLYIPSRVTVATTR